MTKKQTTKTEKIDIINRFTEIFSEKYPGLKPPDMLMKFITSGITDPEKLRNYSIITEYEKIREKDPKASPTSIALKISAQHGNISERQVFNIILQHRLKTNPVG